MIAAVVNAGGIKYAEEKMIQYRDTALDILNAYPDSPEKEALISLVRYTTDRKY